ncbi:hypothetical protein F8388_023326 [Cannabis sativa]|uniref:Uncharacterized protein n=1 Tax=Cannabis sativa TaxID=3483 RepID=A0A7J6HE05_CANSA|nr:hypothetical protein G4B88_013283 [Cannabis sativa]KAF4393522.1 hypothetical protein F8388_023326 [Cannabis sativa]
MTLENGSTAILMLPSGLITSYKAAMWHGGTDEMLHSSVFEEEKGSASIQGGVSLVLDFTTEYAHSWSPTNWALKNISGNSQHSIQVELINSDSIAMVEVKHIVTLKKDELSSEVVISNSSSDFGQKMGFGFGQMLSQMAFWRPNNPNNSNGHQTKSDRGDSGQELEGQSAMLKPIVVEAETVLRLGQDLHNPNL